MAPCGAGPAQHTSHTALPETSSRTTAILSFIGPTTADKSPLQLCGSESLQYCSEQSTPTVTLPPCPLGLGECGSLLTQREPKKRGA